MDAAAASSSSADLSMDPALLRRSQEQGVSAFRDQLVANYMAVLQRKLNGGASDSPRLLSSISDGLEMSQAQDDSLGILSVKQRQKSEKLIREEMRSEINPFLAKTLQIPCCLGAKNEIPNKNLSHNILEDILLNGTVKPKNLPFALLQDITKNFSREREIGSGGFSVVYRGVLESGSVAVKRLFNSQTIEELKFCDEASILMNIKHANIVRFLGFCANSEYQAIKLEGPGTYANYIYAEVRERLLCFEYTSNRSLDHHLTDELQGLEWHTRYGIIKGICEGLQYLHEERSILHMDLKPANILLDDLMVPKITDFGISRHLDHGISQAVTKKLLVSMGYCAPEYLHHGKMSFKSDIYGLGVIIKELVTGRKEDPNIKNVLTRWRYRWNNSATYPPMGQHQVTKCIKLAVTCMDEDSKKRPSISDIVGILNEKESTNEDVSCDNESLVGLGQINPYPWELLVLDPLELHFHFKPNKQMQCTLRLMNERDRHAAFRIRAANTHYEYRIEPSNGVVPPRSERVVVVTLAARQKAPQGVMLTDQLTVRMAVVEDGLTAEEITPDMFDGEPGNETVDEMDLTVVFVTKDAIMS